MGNYKLVPSGEIDDEVLRQCAESWVQHVKAALARAGNGHPRVEMRSVSDGERAVEVVLEYVLEPKVVV